MTLSRVFARIQLSPVFLDKHYEYLRLSLSSMDIPFFKSSKRTRFPAKIGLACLFAFFLTPSHAQKQALEFSLSNVLDKNFNRYANFLAFGWTPPQIDTRYSGSATLAYTRRVGDNWHLLAGGRVVLRRVNYIQRPTVVGGFYHSVVEIPLGLRRVFHFNDRFGINTDIGTGFNLNTTRDESSIHFSADELNSRMQFVNSKKVGVFACVALSVFARISEMNAIAFNVAYQYQFTDMFTLEGRDDIFLSYGTPVKPSYLSFGFTVRHELNW